MDMKVFDKVILMYETLQNEKTPAELDEMFQAGADMQKKIEQMFAIGKDAADDFVKISMLFLELLDQVAQPEGTRALPKPLKECHTLPEVVASL